MATKEHEPAAPAVGPHDLTGFFRAPRWLADLGRSAWYAVGITLAVVALIWVLSLTETIVTPVIAAAVIAAVASPLVGWLQRHRVPRVAGAILVLLGLVVVGVGVFVVVWAGITSQADAVRSVVADGRETIGTWATDLGIDSGSVDTAKDDASSSISSAIPALLEGAGTALAGLSSLVVFLSLTALSLIFLLKDGPLIRAWAEHNMRVPPDLAHAMSGRLLESLRGYFLGVTFVALFNAAVVGIGALIIGVPLAGTIAAVTFIGAYIPYLGAWSAGAFSVLLALGGAGTDAAIAMIVIQLLANGVLQQAIQPIAYGAALGIHPLAVLILTIAGGSLFGAVGLILAAPVTAAVTRIAADLAALRQGTAVTPAPAPAAPGPGC